MTLSVLNSVWRCPLTNPDSQTRSSHHHHLPTVPSTILYSVLGTCSNHDNHTRDDTTHLMVTTQTRYHDTCIPQCHDTGIPQCHDTGIPQCHDTGIPQCHDTGIPQCHDTDIYIP